jgi:chromosome segregation ATPase
MKALQEKVAEMEARNAQLELDVEGFRASYSAFGRRVAELEQSNILLSASLRAADEKLARATDTIHYHQNQFKKVTTNMLEGFVQERKELEARAEKAEAARAIDKEDAAYWNSRTLEADVRAVRAEAEVVKLKAQEIHLEKELAKAEAALADVDPTLKFRSYQIRELSRELLDAEADAEFKVGEVEIDRDCLRDENTRLNERLKVAEAAIARVRALEGAVFTQSAQVSAANWNGWLDARLVREALDGPLNSKGDKT